MNDPNGPVYHQGRHHVFYQWNPQADTWGNIHWGHARSTDLVHWEHLPPALSPDTARGEEHCFSGCCVIPESGPPLIFYTSIGKGRSPWNQAEIWTAEGSPDLQCWIRKATPLLRSDVHSGLEINDWRDPFVWREPDGWHMVLGGAVEGYGCAAHYISSDLESWSFTGLAAKSDEPVLWECPSLTRFDKSYLLIYSPDGKTDSRVRWQSGHFVEGIFMKRKEGVVDHGGKSAYYASIPYRLPDGKVVLQGWAGEGERPTTDTPWGYNGCLAFPREISLDENDDLIINPVAEVRKLPGWVTVGLKPGEGVTLGPGINLTRYPSFVALKREGMPPLTVAAENGHPTVVEAFVDGSLVEVFLDGRTCITARMYEVYPAAALRAMTGAV